MYCVHCGKINVPEAKFCASCGGVMSSATDAPVRKSRFRLRAIHIIAGVLVLALVGGGVLFAHQNKVIEENKQLAMRAESLAQTLGGQLDLNLGNVREDLAQFKVKSAEDAAATEKKFAEQKPVVVEKIVEKPVSQPTVTSIVKTWQPAVGRVVCEFRYSNGQLYGTQSGSGVLITFSDASKNLITNKHVVTDREGYGPTSCTVKFPNNATAYTVGIDDISLSLKGSDMASINMKSKLGSYPNDASASKRNYCANQPEVGDQIVILGYPSIGGGELTATEGIISSHEGSYYVTSAKVEQGNSGGAAVDLSNNCYLGIPTFVQAGQIESLARILKWQAF